MSTRKGGKNPYNILPQTAARPKFSQPAEILMPRAAEGGEEWRN